MSIIEPVKQPARYIIRENSEPILDGMTEVGAITYVNNELEAIYAEGDAEFLAIAPDAGDYKPLPDAGWLEANEIYAYEGKFVIVRQSHYRTIYAPADTPALFSVHRADADGIDWIANEPVKRGMVRLYEGQAYSCLQDHTTQEDWMPPAVPALWAVVEEEQEEIPEWVQPTGAHDAYNIGDRVRFGGKVYESRINANVWSPAVYPAGWLEIVA